MNEDEDLRILFVEDVPEDVEIAIRELEGSGMRFRHLRVDTKEDFQAALAAFDPSLVISDYSMPRFDGIKALNIALELKPSIPFIVLTGSKNEETAVLCLKSGAADYVIKGHITRLPFAVNDALDHTMHTREKEIDARALRENEQNYRTLADSGQALVWACDVDKRCTYFNKPRLEFTGGSLEKESGIGWLDKVHPDDRAAMMAGFVAAFDRREKFSQEYRMLRHDGQYRWIQDDGSPRYSVGGEFLGYIGHCLDITERKRIEESLKQALEEKETLLRELFHRTRNNMQVIMAILSFEEEAAHDEKVSKIVRETNDRIMSMSLVHKKLFESQDLSRIDLKDYADDLIGFLMEDSSFPIGRISVKTMVESMPLLIDSAIPCGLVLQELVSNAFRHAFPGDSKGEVRITIGRSDEGSVELEVADDGVGLPEHFDYRKQHTLGFQLITGLVEQQLKGSLRFESGHGLSCHVSFTDAQMMKRV